MRLFAALQNMQGNRLLGKAAFREAEARYRMAIRQAPRWVVPWHNLGLLYKRERNWPEAFRCWQTAAQLNPRNRTAWWNLGIAATALQDWPEARRAWNSLGISIRLGSQDPNTYPELVPIRVDPQGSAEVVWCSRIDPARAMIRSVPFPQSGRRFGDLLLHDGMPNGIRILKGREFPVFDELEVLTPSAFATFEVVLSVTSAKDVQALIDSVEAHHLGAENWTTLRLLRRAASEGRADVFPQPPQAEPGEPVHVGLAAETKGEARSLLDAWLSNHPGCQVLEITGALASPGAPPHVR